MSILQLLDFAEYMFFRVIHIFILFCELSKLEKFLDLLLFLEKEDFQDLISNIMEGSNWRHNNTGSNFTVCISEKWVIAQIHMVLN